MQTADSRSYRLKKVFSPSFTMIAEVVHQLILRSKILVDGVIRCSLSRGQDF